MKIRQMIFLLLLVCSIIPMALVGSWGLKLSENRIEDLLTESLQATAEMQLQLSERFFSEEDYRLKTIGNFQMVQMLLQASNHNEKDKIRELRPFIDDVMKSQCKEYDSIESLTLLDRDFRIIGCNFPVETWRSSKLKYAAYSYTKDQVLFTDVVDRKLSSRGKRVIAGIRPIYQGEELCGYIVEELNLSYFENMRRNIGAVSGSIIYLVDRGRNVIAAGNQNLTTEGYQKQTLDTQDFSQKWQARSEQEKKEGKGVLVYKSNGQRYITYYSGLKNVGWRIFVSANLDQLLRKDDIQQAVLLFCALLALLLLWGNYLISRRIARPVESLIEQILEIKQDKSVRLRLRRMPDNEIGQIAATFNELLADVEKRERELCYSQEKYHIVMNKTKQIFIERDYQKKCWTVSEKFEEIFGYLFPYSSLSRMEDFTEYLHPKDRKRYCHWLIKSYQTDEDMQIEMRVRDVYGNYLWVRYVLIPVFGETGEVIASIGLMNDIDEERQKFKRLEEKAQLDPLTKLLNKEAAGLAAASMIGGEKEAALLFFDIDDFKDFNTRYGHLGGDAVLKFVARQLRQCFEGQAGRIGGDEFIAWTADVEGLEQKISSLLKRLTEGFTLNESGEHVKVRCSIGAAVYPQSAATYEELLQKADEAMYRVKNTSKAAYFILK